MRLVEFRELAYIIHMVTHQLVSIAIAAVHDISVRDTVYVRLYTASRGIYDALL